MLVALAYRPPVHDGTTPLSGTSSQAQVAQVTPQSAESTVDKVTATSIASVYADTTNLPVSNDVANLSQSLTVESLLSQTSTNVISKPQIVQASAGSRSVIKYTTVAGDTIPLLAQKYQISDTTMKWANNLTSDALEPGKVLTILPVDGVIYTTKDGDSIDAIVSKYGADRVSFVTYNDLELTGTLVAGRQLIIPGGSLPQTERPGYVAPRVVTVASGINYTSYSGGYGTSWGGGMSSGNRYGIGQCTWYAYERRLQLGNPVGGMWGNANTWAYNARISGFLVDGNPTVGAVMANGGGYGHVAIVESVNPGESITISEMNGYRFGGGWNRVGHGEIEWSQATSGMYSYIH